MLAQRGPVHWAVTSQPEVVSLLKQQNVLIRTLIAKTYTVEGEQYSARKNISHNFFVEA